jgi:hypothetical protein
LGPRGLGTIPTGVLSIPMLKMAHLVKYILNYLEAFTFDKIVHIVDNFPVQILLHRCDEFLPAPPFFGTFGISHIYVWNPLLP